MHGLPSINSLLHTANYGTPPLLVKGSRDPSVRSERLPTVVVAL